MRKFLICLLVTLVSFSYTQAQIQVLDNSVWDISWRSDGSMLAVAGNFGIQIYDSHFQTIHRLTQYPAYSVDWNPEGTLLASSNQSPESVNVTIDIWNIISAQNIASISVPSPGVWRLAWSPDSQYLAAATFNDGIYIYRVNTWTLANHLPLSYLEDVSWSPDGKHIAASASRLNTPALINIWSINEGNLALSIDLTATERIYNIQGIAWSPDGTKIALGVGPSNKGAIPILDVASQNIEVGFVGPLDIPNFVAWSPDGTQFVSTYSGSTLSEAYLWDASGKQLWQLFGGEDEFKGGAWKPDGSQLALLKEVSIPDIGFKTILVILDPASSTEIAVPSLPAVTPTVVVNGSLWNDLNHDGIRQEEETPLSEITLNLLDSDQTVIQTVTTSINGIYRFEAVPGTYIIEVSTSSYIVSAADQGQNDLIDSDFDPVSYRTESITLDNGDVITLDAGLSLP